MNAMGCSYSNNSSIDSELIPVLLDPSFLFRRRGGWQYSMQRKKNKFSSETGCLAGNFSIRQKSFETPFRRPLHKYTFYKYKHCIANMITLNHHHLSRQYFNVMMFDIHDNLSIWSMNRRHSVLISDI